MSQWTSEYAILRDLSVAQGRVPVAIENSVGAGDKPPSLNITEETEEEFYKHCSADGNVADGPDLGLIQKMLDMVRDTGDGWSNEDNDNGDKAIVITKVFKRQTEQPNAAKHKLNPHCPEFKPNQENTSTPTSLSPTRHVIEKQKKRQRNIALESILQAIEDNKTYNKEIVLRKPNDFITKVETIKKEPEVKESSDVKVLNKISDKAPTAVEKVNGWLKTQTESPFPKKTSKVTLEAASIVFKKKEKVKKVEKLPKNLKNLIASPTSSTNSGEYIPSTLANEYYQKYVERNKFKESVKEDIWSKAERKMKEIDEKRRREALEKVASPTNESEVSRQEQSFEEIQNTDAFTERIQMETRINRCLDVISLPQHRHLLTGPCVVCEVMSKPKLPTNKQPLEITDDKEDSSLTSEDDSKEATEDDKDK